MCFLTSATRCEHYAITELILNLDVGMEHYAITELIQNLDGGMDADFDPHE
jgi:hypothetical protein